jgi:ribosomal protein L17
VTEKIITLARGAEMHQQRRGVKSLVQYASSIQHLVNTTILGTRNHPKQWRLFLGKKKIHIEGIIKQ